MGTVTEAGGGGLSSTGGLEAGATRGVWGNGGGGGNSALALLVGALLVIVLIGGFFLYSGGHIFGTGTGTTHTVNLNVKTPGKGG